MAARDKLGVGIVGASASRGFASIAHIPALQALPQFEIVAVCTRQQETAEAAARRYGARLAFADPAQMAAHPDVDLVTVSVKVPDHCKPVMGSYRGWQARVLRMAARPRHRRGRAHARCG